MPLTSEYRIEVLTSFEALKIALAKAQEYICRHDASLPGWFQAPLGLSIHQKMSCREQAFALLSQLEYLEHQKPKEILVGAGLFAASKETIEAITVLNACKDRFKKAILALKSAKISLSDPTLSHTFEELLGKRSKELAENLKKMGLARLHLKQCYRRIPCLDKRPDKVSWTWANTRAITRISVQDAEQLLLKQGQSHNITWQLNKLYTLSSNEPLAIVQKLAPHLRTNIVFPNGSLKKRLMVKGPVPLFYLEDDLNLPLPEIRPPSEKQGRRENRLIRSDSKLDPEPFLPAIRVHRYLR